MSSELLKEGAGTFCIMNSEEYISKSGSQCAKITTKICDVEGKECWYTMYIRPDIAWGRSRLKALYSAIGKAMTSNEANGENLDYPGMIGKIGECTIKTEISKSPEYPDPKSVIYTFITKKINTFAPNPTYTYFPENNPKELTMVNNHDDDDEIPF